MNGNSRRSHTSSSKKDNCCSRRTKPEICLAITLIIVLVYTLWYTYIIGLPTVNVVCMSFECLKSSVEIETSIDPSIEPCQDFHQFVCGGLIKSYIADGLLVEKKQLETELTSFLNGPLVQDDSQAVQTQKTFYNSCLDLHQIDKDSNRAVLVALIEELGGWPVVLGQNWQESDFDWIETVYKCRKLGLPFDWFLDFDIQHSSDANRFSISIPNCKQFKLPDLRAVMVAVAREFSASKLTAINQLNHVVQFEEQLANICEKARLDAKTTVLTVSELDEVFPKYNWLDIIANITQESGAEINETSEIATNVQNYVWELDQLLIKTSNRTLGNFIIWQIIASFAPFTPDSIRSIFEKSAKKAAEVAWGIDRENFCFRVTQTKFYYLSEREYINKYTTSTIKEAITKMTSLIRNGLVKFIANLRWINSEIKDIYMEKLNTTVYDIGGQPEHFSENFLLLSQFNFTSSNLIEMLTELARNQYRSKFQFIAEEGIDADNFAFYEFNTVPEIHFNYTKNRLIVPAPLLHGSTFSINRPMYLNYASLGTLIASKLAGILLEPEEAANSTQDIQTSVENINYCFQRTNEAAGIEISDENLLVGEFFNSVGRDLAYSAYKKWEEERENGELGLLNSDFSNYQLFWIKSSLGECSSGDNNGPLMNSEYFGVDWECSRSNTRMNPKNKCLSR